MDFFKTILTVFPLVGFFIILNKYLKLRASRPLASGKGLNVEIERKFLVDKDKLPSNLKNKSAVFELKQSYIAYSPEIRLRNADNRNFIFTMKSKNDDSGLVRNEIEFPISKDEYKELEAKADVNVINKTRYHYNDNGHVIIVDFYKEKHEGLITAEVEFNTIEEANAFIPPEWFSKEVTTIPSFKNANLAKNADLPF